jgi:hypothetical protein
MTADPIGGVWTYAIELSRALAARGMEIALATMGAPVCRSRRAEVGSIPNAELFENTYKLEWMNRPWDDVDAAGDWLRGKLSKRALHVAVRFTPSARRDCSPTLLSKGAQCGS